MRIIDMDQAFRGNKLVAVGVSAGFCLDMQGVAGLFYEDEQDQLNRMATQGHRVAVFLDDVPPLRKRAALESAAIDRIWAAPGVLGVPGFSAARGEALAALCHHRSLRMKDVAYIATSPLDREVALGAGRVFALADAGDEVRRMADAVLPARASGGLLMALLRAQAYNPS